MKLSLTNQDFKRSWSCRNISKNDIHSLGKLMLESYRDTIDYEGEGLEEAISEVRATISGKYGRFLEQCSFIIEENGQPLSACMITWYEEMEAPLVSFTMTYPDFKNLGMAGFLLQKSINALLDQGYKELCLAVTEGNTAARHLYEKIGFQAFEEDSPKT